MNPHNDQFGRRVVVPTSDQHRAITPPPRDYSGAQSAAANVIREQINAIYNDGNQNKPQPVATSVKPAAIPQPAQTTQQPITPQAEPVIRPIHDTQPTHNLRTQPVATKQASDLTASSDAAQSTTPTTQPKPQAADHWKQYHSAWQQYYQMYYERYYANHLNTKQQELDEFVKTSEERLKKAQANTGTQATSDDPRKTAMLQLRQRIQQKVRDSAKQVKRSRHFVPVLSGVLVLVIFMFLQYNRILFGAVAAYTTPGNIDPRNIIVDPSIDVNVSEDPRMVIPKLNIDAPVIYGVPSDHNSQMKAMEKGIAHFSIAGANAVPGQVGNAVFAAHSSNDAFASGDYKFVFAQNEKLQKNDLIYMNYNGKRYTYSVTATEVVLPTEVGKVQLSTDKPMLTLVSCVPLGTAEKRLLVFAEQISPDPAKAAPQTSEQQPATPQKADIPGKPSPTLLERLFGAR